MAAAVVQLQIATGSGPTLASAESGFKYNRFDAINDTTAVPIPTATGTNYSFLKWLCLAVTTLGTTTMSNRRIQLSATETSGLAIFFQGNATYTQATSANMPGSPAGSNSGNGPQTPTGFTRATTALQVYDNTSTSTGSTGRNGNYCETAFGVDFTYAGGAGSAVAMPDIRLVYDEA